MFCGPQQTKEAAKHTVPAALPHVPPETVGDRPKKGPSLSVRAAPRGDRPKQQGPSSTKRAAAPPGDRPAEGPSPSATKPPSATLPETKLGKHTVQSVSLGLVRATFAAKKSYLCNKTSASEKWTHLVSIYATSMADHKNVVCRLLAFVSRTAVTKEELIQMRSLLQAQ